MNTLRKLEAKWFEAAATEFLAEEESDVRGILTSCASQLSAELPKWERLEKSAQRVTDAFRALGESTPWTREADRTRHECEAAMLELDDALKDVQE